MVKGGLDGWRRAGLPTNVDRSEPIELQREVQIGAGGVIRLGTLFGLTGSSWFFAVRPDGSGIRRTCRFCGMALLLPRARWNRATCSAT